MKLKGLGYPVFYLFVALGLAWSMGTAIWPLLASFFFVYLVFPLVTQLENRGFRREWAAVLLFGGFVLLSIGVFVALVPVLLGDARQFFHELPHNFRIALERTEVILRDLGVALPMDRSAIVELLREYSGQVSTQWLKSLGDVLKGSVLGVTHSILFVVNIFLFPVFFFYVLSDYEKIVRELKTYIPKRWNKNVTKLSGRANEILSGYIRGQLLVCLTMGLFYALGLTIVGIRFGFLIGIVTGFLCIIPYAGFTMGLTAALVMTTASASGLHDLVGVLIVFGVGQTIESLFVTPKIVEDKVGLSALATMIALMVGGNLFGLLGMLVAIPVTAIIKEVFKELKFQYQTSSFYSGRKS